MHNKTSKNILLGIATLMCSSALLGGVFANYIVTAASPINVRVGLNVPQYYLFKGSEATGLKLDYDDNNNLLIPSLEEDASDFTNIELDYNQSFSIKVTTNGTDYDTLETLYTANEEGAYTFSSYDIANSLFDVTQTKRALYVYVHNPVKVYQNMYIYDWYVENEIDHPEVAWDDRLAMVDTTIDTEETIDTDNIKLYRSLVGVEYTKVIFSTKYGSYARQTGNLDIPTDKKRATYDLNSFELDSGIDTYGEWIEKPDSGFVTNDQVNASSWSGDGYTYISGSMNSWPSSTLNNYALEILSWDDTSHTTNETRIYAITIKLAQGASFKIKYDGDGNAWNEAAVYSTSSATSIVFSDYFEQSAANDNIVVSVAGVYTFYVYQDSDNGWVLKVYDVVRVS